MLEDSFFLNARQGMSKVGGRSFSRCQILDINHLDAIPQGRYRFEDLNDLIVSEHEHHSLKTPQSSANHTARKTYHNAITDDFERSRARTGKEHLRRYQLHLLHDCKLAVETIVGRISALRFLFLKILRLGT